MKLTLTEVHIKDCKLTPTEVGSGGYYQTATATLIAPAGPWPTGASNVSIAGTKFRSKQINIQSPEDPVSVTFCQLDARGKKPTAGTKQWALEAARIKSVKLVRQKGGEPLVSLQIYVKKGVKLLADWYAEKPSWSGAIILESVEKGLFDDFTDPIDEPEGGDGS